MFASPVTPAGGIRRAASLALPDSRDPSRGRGTAFGAAELARSGLDAIGAGSLLLYPSEEIRQRLPVTGVDRVPQAVR
jgi:hypothetical protein